MLTELCDECHSTFMNEDDWNARHSGKRGEEYHVECCPVCKIIRETDQ